MKDKLPIDPKVVDECHSNTITLIEELVKITGCSPGDSVFDDEGFGAEESLWDSVVAPSKTRVNSVRKDDLVGWVERVGKLLIEKVYPIMKKQGEAERRCLAAEKKLVERQEELLSSQRALVEAQAQLVKLQAQLLEKREAAITSVKTTAQEEMRSFASVLKKGCDTALAPQRIQRAVAAASKAEDRSCNIIVYGLPDNAEGNEDLLPELWTTLTEKPLVKSAQRLGRFSEGQTRPLRISLASRETQSCVLSKKTRLRQSEVFSRVYISPDLTPEERVARGILVKQLKEKKEQCPGMSFRIKGGEVVEVPSGAQ